MRQIIPPYYYQYRYMRESTQNPRHPDYSKYGAKGITCAWGPRQYQEFYSWLITTLGPRPGPRNDYNLGRIDKTGNWEPGNIEWQTVVRRSRTNHKQVIYMTYKRKKQSLSDWAEQLDIPYYTFRRRVAEGMTIPEIIKEFK
jgi:hypothetical protein